MGSAPQLSSRNRYYRCLEGGCLHKPLAAAGAISGPGSHQILRPVQSNRAPHDILHRQFGLFWLGYGTQLRHPAVANALRSAIRRQYLRLGVFVDACCLTLPSGGAPACKPLSTGELHPPPAAFPFIPVA